MEDCNKQKDKDPQTSGGKKNPQKREKNENALHKGTRNMADDGIAAALIELGNRLQAEQKEDENHRQDLCGMLEVLGGEYKRQEEELQKERAAFEKERAADHQKQLSSEAREHQKVLAAMAMGGLVGAALVHYYDPSWWKRLRQMLERP